MTTRRSLGTRLLAATLATASVTLAGVVGLVVVRANQNLTEQAHEVSRWSEARLSERLHSDALLAAARLDFLRDDVERRFASMVKRPDIAKAISSGNTVAVSELLRPALALADMEGAIVFDGNLKSLSADAVDARLLDANAAVRTSVLASPLRDIISRNDPTNPRGFVRSLTLEAGLAAALAATEVGETADIFGQPIFDEFGEVSAVMVGYRVMKKREAVLESFAALSGRDVLIFRGDQLISSAGASIQRAEIVARPGSELRALAGLAKVAHCQSLPTALRLCVAAPISELEHLTEKVVGIGEDNSRSLLTTLAAAAALALTLFGIVALALSRHITKPLVRITEVVTEVARGNWRTVVPGTSRPDEVGSIARAVLVLEHSLEERDRLREDITVQNERLKTNERELQDQNARFDAALSNMSQGLCMFDSESRLKVFNPQLLDIYRLPPTTLQPGMSAQAQRAITFAATSAITGTEGPTSGSEIRTLPDDRIIHVTTQRMADGGWVETHEDETESRQAQARIAHMAMYDALTDLPNRVLFHERLAQAHAAWVSARRPFSILCLDLDDFKGINDTLGHGVGDDLLKAVAARLLANVPPGATVARLGGDEFAILVHDFADGGIALAQGLTKLLKQPVRLASQTVVSAASIGVAACTDAHEEAEQLLRKADLALYSAKADGRGRFRVFDPAMESRAQHRKWLERELREALSAGQVSVYYQPIYDIASNRISGFEALSRWTHPEIGPISPGEFIPLAEEVGLMDALGEYVLARACADAAAWPVPAKVAVNISAVQIGNANFCDMVMTVLARTGLPSSRLELEITESVVLGDEPEVLGKLHRLRALGVRFSMDDFGTGYSSLSSLRSFPFDKIKLDQSFVRDALEREDCATIVRVVADLGRSLRMTTTAEGVEKVQQLASLKAAGYTEAQGYLFSPAVPNQQVERMLEAPFQLVRAA